MGAYLSEPITEKISNDEANEFITCGASSMQGWRMSQEDAHNCVLDFDANTSLFAVYDGHGGAEVALYCAQKLPEFLKTTDEYKTGKYEQALKNAFIGFDATLTQDKVHAELKSLIPADKRDRESETEEDIDDGEDDIEELAELCQESRMPLNELLEKYKDGKKNLILNKVKKDDESAAKPISPYLRGRRNNRDDTDGGGSSSGLCSGSKPCSSEAVSSNVKRKMNDDVEDEQVSSSSASSSNNMEKVATELSSSSNEASGSSNGPTSSSNDANAHKSGENSTYISPDSSSTKNKKTPSVSAELSSTSSSNSSSTNASEATQMEAKSIANGDVVSGCDKSQENEISTNSTKAESVSSSSSAGLGDASSHSAENGEVSSNSISQADKSFNNISSTNDCKTKKNLPVLGDDTSSEDEEDASYNEDKSSTEDGDDCEMESEEDTDDDDDDEEEDEEDEDDDLFPEQDIDESFLNDMVEGPGSSSGCTAVVALLVGRDLYVANAGDSRCVVCRNGEALEMSIDHKPEDVEELERIRKAGGDVSLDGRVNGGLNLSRAIGDHAYKQNKSLGPEEQMISALPDVKKITISDGDEFMIIACDGIWNFMSSEEVVQFIKPKLAEKRTKISTICEELFTNCLATDTLGDGTGCDNMTAVLIQFKPDLIAKPINISNNSENVLSDAPRAENLTRKRSASPSDIDNSIDTHKKRIKINNQDHAAPGNASEKATTPAVVCTEDNTK